MYAALLIVYSFSLTTNHSDHDHCPYMTEPFVNNAERLLMELLGIAGVSGEEREIMERIASLLRAAGAKDVKFDQAHRRIPHGGQIGNLVCKLPGTIPGRRRLLLAHVDTVPLCQGARPVRRGQWIVPRDKHTGLGGDDRAGTAAILSAALEILRRKLPHPPLSFLWTVQEEVGLFGARFSSLGMLGKPALAFNFDGGSTEKITLGRHRRLPAEYPRRRPRQPCRSESRAGGQRHHHRLAGHRPVARPGVAGANCEG